MVKLAEAGGARRWVLATGLMAMLWPLGWAGAQTEQNPCKAALLMDAASGRVLDEFNAREALPPASMVKMMTTYVALKKLREGRFKEDDIVTVSAAASRIGGSQVYLKEKEQFTLKEILEAVMVQSANDAAYALAEHMAGHPSGFVELMNVEAKRLGMTESTFYTPHGLPPAAGGQPDVASAYDMAVLGRALIYDFPDSLYYSALSERPFRGGAFLMRNHNRLVRSFPGCDGLKTGFYSKAGFCVTATALRNDVRLIAVLMGCPQSRQRDAEAARMLSVGFALYRHETIIEKGQDVGQVVPVLGGVPQEIRPVAAEDLKVLLKSVEKDQIEKDFRVCQELEAPVAQGSACGGVVVRLNGENIGRTALIVPVDVPKAGLLDRAKQWLGR